MTNKILLVFRAINHRTLMARKYSEPNEQNTREIYRAMNISVIQTLLALDILDNSQYNDLYQKLYHLETIHINDINNLL